MKKQQLKALQREWYDKLKETGFDDIEDTNSPREMLKTWHSRCFLNKNEVETSAKAEYYTNAQQVLYSYKFRTMADQMLWEYHANGLSIREIAAATRDSPAPMHRSSVFRALKRIIKALKLELEYKEDAARARKK